jgi:hypothetical protein
MTITTERRWPAAANIALLCARRRVEWVLVVLGTEIMWCAAILRFDIAIGVHITRNADRIRSNS